MSITQEAGTEKLGGEEAEMKKAETEEAEAKEAESENITPPSINSLHMSIGKSSDNTSSNSTDDAITSTFSLFPKLAAELRIKIWKLAQPPPRIVEVICAAVRVDHDKESLYYRFLSQTPVLLHVCRESRIEAKKVFKLLSQTEHSLNGAYFDFEEDILFPRVPLAFHSVYQLEIFAYNFQEKGPIKRLALSPESTMFKSKPGIPYPPLIMSFPNLEELIFVRMDRKSLLGCTAHCDKRWTVLYSDIKLGRHHRSLVYTKEFLAEARLSRYKNIEWKTPKIIEMRMCHNVLKNKSALTTTTGRR